MPSPKKLDHTTILAQIPDDIHAQADSRRRRDGITWAKLITTLLKRWCAGVGDQDFAAPIRPRPFRPSPEQDTEHRRAAKLRDPDTNIGYVDPSSIRWHGSLADVFRAEARRSGKVVPAETLDGLDDDAEAGE